MTRTIRHQGTILRYELMQTRRKSIELRVDMQGNVKVFAPIGMPLRSVDTFVSSKLDFIRDARGKADAFRRQQAQAHPVRDGARVLLEGDVLTLRVRSGKPARLERSGDELILTAPDCGDGAVRETLRGLLIDMALNRIVERLRVYGPLVGRPYGRVTIREQKTRWGSCSSKHNLNFNWKLIQAPPQALDYVVIHELCHLIEFNHSPRFWRLVEQYQSDYKTWKSWLKKNGSTLGI